MRTFVAIELPENIRAELARQQQAFRASCRDARWTRPEGIHLTLKFLGEISAPQLAQVSEALAGIEPFAPFDVEIAGFGSFPDARRPRVFWAGVERGAAVAELAEHVEAALEKLGFEREHRTFSPHLTLARFKTPRPQPALVEAVESLKDFSFGRFQASEFFLFESQLAPQGASYRKLARFPEAP
jgi:RNA 2',3'-cyclic 3'-phosphodiesterase